MNSVPLVSAMVKALIKELMTPAAVACSNVNRLTYSSIFADSLYRVVGM